MSVTLRSIQVNATSLVSQAFMDGAAAVILQACTGYGKTVVASNILNRAAQRGNRGLFLAHQDTLIRQTSRKLREFDCEHGIIMAGYTPNHHARVQVASIQTMVRRIRKFRYEFELIIVDEAHRSIANSYREVFAAIPDARILGITGTPSRLDGRGLGVTAGGIYDTLIQTESFQELVDLGYLVPPIYYASKEKLDLSRVKVRAGEYDDTELAAVVDTPVITGNAVEHYKELTPGQPALTWCVNIAHAEHTAAQFNAAGIPSAVLSGKHTGEERDRIIGMLERREILNICFAQLLIEGVDIPCVRVLIMLRPSKSLTGYLQFCGRGARIDPKDCSKLSYIILDHAGLAFTHGLCNEDREWSLEGRQKKKKKTKDSLALLQCKECFLIFEPKDLVDSNKLKASDPANNGVVNCCPGCGKEMKRPKREGPEHVDGKLVKITDDVAAQMRRNRQIEVKKAQTLAELEAIGKARGYNEDWAKIQWSFKETAQRRARERANERWGLDQQTGY
jgi:DNA repair protein RadD